MHGVDPQVAGLAALAGLAPLADAGDGITFTPARLCAPAAGVIIYHGGMVMYLSIPPINILIIKIIFVAKSWFSCTFL